MGSVWLNQITIFTSFSINQWKSLLIWLNDTRRQKFFLNQQNFLLDIHEHLVKSNKFWLIEINFFVEFTKYSDLVKTTKQSGWINQIWYFVRSTKHFDVCIISKFCCWTNQNFVNSNKSTDWNLVESVKFDWFPACRKSWKESHWLVRISEIPLIQI